MHAQAALALHGSPFSRATTSTDRDHRSASAKLLLLVTDDEADDTVRESVKESPRRAYPFNETTGRFERQGLQINVDI